MSLYLNENFYLSNFVEFETILEKSRISLANYSDNDIYCALIYDSLYLKVDGPFDKITEIIYSEFLESYSGFITGIISGNTKNLNLKKFSSLKAELQFENGNLIRKKLFLLNNLTLEEKEVPINSLKCYSILDTDWTFRGDIKDIYNPNNNYSNSIEDDYKNFENPWNNVFGNSDEAETAYWNTD